MLRCTDTNCSCECFLPEPFDLRSCERCKHGWVMHALSKLSVCSDQVEVVHPGVVCDLSALILFSTHAFPIRMKILLDRLFSVLTHQHVLNALHTHGWTLHDYVRGYKLQDSSGKVLDFWVLMTPRDESVALHQFLRFGETKSIAELMISQHSRLLLSPNVTTSTPHQLVLNTSQSLQMDGITRGQRSPGSSHLGNLSGGIEECCESSSSCLRKIPGESCSLQRDQGTRLGDNAESPAGIVASALIWGGGERKHQGVGDCRSCSSSVRKSRVSCGLCGKTFYDRGTLKIHYNAVHLKIKHRCTVEGCGMLFSSLRSRNRHSANPNPRLHHTHHTHHTHSMTCQRSSSQSSTSAVKFPQEVKLFEAAMLAPASTLCVNTNNYTEMIDQRKISVYSANSEGGGASTHLWTNQNTSEVTGSTARRKSRKSSMPVKIKRETGDNGT
ncbi:zinc finger protein basonuclin-1 [Tachysurus fulvidraco]|uniref:zinc finger protein basonuclin-1 n=1 Tax=Tachysurus fulvidraco TaxID=1234273 RepID=UPI001FEDC558|nr:zinc finger protein basonuclin-1 [Tachysurus fulvidraco]